MVEAAALLSFYLAFALRHGADPRRFPVPRWRPTRGPLRLMNAGAAAAAIAGIALWTRAENTTSALLVAVAALSTAATAFVLLGPLFPRAVWVSVVACPPLVAILALLGGGNG
jgi:multisubunit Na+/H+ antiporter MnhB subunit